ncbi:MAG: hypothetical protein NXI22_21400 [bacterium]|nr:hypothetical protein [bacterium]
MKLFSIPDEALIGRRAYGFFDDFDHLVSGDRWTDTSGDTGASVSVADGVGGAAALVTGGDDNNEVYLHSTTELFKFADNKPLIVEALLQYSEANTDDANVMFGLMDNVGANALQDDGAGPKTSYSGALFFKADGDTLWSVQYSDGATQQTVQLSADAAHDGFARLSGGANAQTFRIEFAPYGGAADVRFFIDHVLVYAFQGVSFTNASEMEAVVGLKAGGANSETANVDYLFAYQRR